MPPRLQAPNVATSSRWWYGPLWLAAVAGVTLLAFFLKFGHIDGLAWGAAAVMCMVAAAGHWGSGLNARSAKSRNEGYQRRRRASGRELSDVLAVVWFFSILIAPLGGWMLTGFVDLTPTNWRWRLGVRGFACVVVPLVCVVPMLKFIRGQMGKATFIFLFVGMFFPVTTGWNSALDAVRGAKWQQVEITGVRVKSAVFKHSRYTQTDRFIDLADGRTLRISGTPKFGTGRFEILVLRASGRIIDSRGEGSP